MGLFDGLFRKKQSASRFILERPSRESKGLVGQSVESMSQAEIETLSSLCDLLNQQLLELEGYFAKSPAKAKHKDFEKWLLQGSFQLLMLDICVIGHEVRNKERGESLMNGLIRIVAEASFKHQNAIYGDESNPDFESILNQSQRNWAMVMNNYTSSDDKRMLQGVAQITNLILFAPSLKDEAVISMIAPGSFYTNRGSIDFDIRNNSLDFGSFYKSVDIPGLIQSVRSLFS